MSLSLVWSVRWIANTCRAIMCWIVMVFLSLAQGNHSTRYVLLLLSRWLTEMWAIRPMASLCTSFIEEINPIHLFRIRYVESDAPADDRCSRLGCGAPFCQLRAVCYRMAALQLHIGEMMPYPKHELFRGPPRIPSFMKSTFSVNHVGTLWSCICKCYCNMETCSYTERHV